MYIDFEVFDHKENKVLFTGKADFGPGLIDILSVNSPDSDISVSFAENFLDNRALLMAPKTYEDDALALNELDLVYNKHRFGRMNEAYVLLAMLNNFAVSDDEIRLYPIKNELICMYNWNSKYGTIYPWSKRKE